MVTPNPHQPTALAVLQRAEQAANGANHSTGDGGARIALDALRSALAQLCNDDLLSTEATTVIAASGGEVLHDVRDLSRLFGQALGADLSARSRLLASQSELASSLLPKTVADANAALDAAQKAHRETQSMRDEATQAAESAKTSATKAAEFAYAELLREERKAHTTLAKKMTCLLMGLAAAWLGLLLAFGWTVLDAAREFRSLWWVPIAGRAATLATLGGVIVWVMRLYRAERHNVISYAQKLAALSTFESFVSTANRDQDAKAAIIAHAMGTIFAAHDTGYGAMSDAESAMPTEALIKAFSKATDVAARKTASNIATGSAPHQP